MLVMLGKGNNNHTKYIEFSTAQNLFNHDLITSQ